MSVLLTSFCLPEIFGGEEQLRQAELAAGVLIRVSRGIGRARGIVPARILDLALAALRVGIARS